MSVHSSAVSSEIGFKPGSVYLAIDDDAANLIMMVMTAEPVFEDKSFVRALVSNGTTQWELDSWNAHVNNWVEARPWI
jgi:hypothetical protein